MVKSYQTIQEIQQDLAKSPFSWLMPPVVLIEIYVNKIRATVTADIGTQQFEQIANPPFSTQRLILADFEALVLNVKELSKKLQKKWYQGGRVYIIDVKDDLVGGLSRIESKVLKEAFWAGAKASRVFVFYQGQGAD